MFHFKNGRLTAMIALSAMTAAASGFAAVEARADDSSSAAASSSTPPAPTPEFTTSGLIDAYYAYQFNNPKASPGDSNDFLTPSVTAGSAYTFRQSTPTIALAELNITAAAAPGKISGKATLTTGDEASVNHGMLTYNSATGRYELDGTRESRFQNIQQLYATFTPTANKLAASIDFGKFYTPFGYEVAESNANFNYTRSCMYDMLPVYHMGFRITSVPLGPLTTTLYVVNALMNSATEGVSSNNTSPAGIASFSYADPKGKYTAVETLGGGTDKPVTNPGVSSTNEKNFINDLDFTYNLNAKTTFGAEYTYISSQYDGQSKSETNGGALYYRYQINPKDAIALRVASCETKQDDNHFKPSDITATYEIKAAANWLTRFEYRYDAYKGSGPDGDVTPYLDSNGDYTKSSQSTVFASEVFTF